MKCRTVGCNREHDLVIPEFTFLYPEGTVYINPDTKKEEPLKVLKLPIIFPLCTEHASNVRSIYEFFEAKKKTVNSMIRSRARLGHLLDFSGVTISFLPQKDNT